MSKKIFNINSNLTPISSNPSNVSKPGKKPEEKFEIEYKVSEPKKKKKISFIQLFRYATFTEKVLVILGLILQTIGAMGIPFSTIIYGEFTSLLVDRTVRTGTSTPTIVLQWFGGGQQLTNASIEENRLALLKDSDAFGLSSLAGAAVQFIVCLVGVDVINYSANRQISRIRKLFFESILRQDMTWYDILNKDTNFSSNMTEDLDKIKEGLGEKIGIFTYLVMTFVSSLIISFFYGWKLTLVVLSCTPVIIISTAIVAKIQSSLTEKELKSYAVAGNLAEEVFTNIRTVVAFSGGTTESERYAKDLVGAERTGIKKGFYSGIGGGIMWFIIYCVEGLALWYGVQLIIEDSTKAEPEYTPAILIIVLFGVLVGAQNFGFTSPHIEAFGVARGAAANVFSVIDRKSRIDPLSDDGLKPDIIQGNIEFQNIKFRYPARSDVPILKGLNLTVKAGQTVALVGPSGCGKSTCLQLLQRLYNPLMGTVKLDGLNINAINVGWLRSIIGVVGQEPVLFATTIGENIRYGKPSASDDDIVAAAKVANCHSFIDKLPEKYNTMVGERGAQLSGGQKQRIAIARAIIRDPKILLLDEATSALDPTSEKRVQEALEVASKGRTTLVVSHRLSTITNVDKIVYIKDGSVAEEGNHQELMAKQGLYYDLVMTTKRLEDDDDEISQSSNESHSPIPLKRENSVLSSIAEQNDQEKFEDNTDDYEKVKVSTWQLLKLNKPEWLYILIGCLAAILYGSSLPAFAIIFGEFFGMLSLPDKAEVARQSEFYAYLFILLGVISGVGTLLQFYMFNIAGVRLTSRLRKLTFNTIISQEMAWFDRKSNSVGALCSRLSGDCANVQGATGSRIGSIIQSLATLFIGVVISFVFSWNLALVTLLTVPLVFGSIIFEARYMSKSYADEKKAIEDASQVAVEAISNIRTVTSLGQEPYVLQRYYKNIDSISNAISKKTRFRGVVFSLGQAAPFLAYGVSLYYGGILVANNGLEYKNVIKVSEALIFGAWALGQALAYAPNVNAALVSAARLIRLFKRVPKMHDSAQTAFNSVEKIDGDISYNNVEFRYPNRPEASILRGLNLAINKGSTVALVGPSGCGKSTCIQLLLRYYDPNMGDISLSNVPTTEFPMDTLRSQLGLVSQEPILFDRTIAENIAYGDNFRKVPMQEIIQAAMKSNIHDFIKNLPLGYNTSLGSKGAQLSGGQKQRIAIARALVRNPKILILDEATSALDMQSEKIVQDALDAASSGRTCITIAHRLSTIQNADVICVLKSGRIIEQGTHDELFKLNGKYTELYKMQQIH